MNKTNKLPLQRGAAKALKIYTRRLIIFLAVTIFTFCLLSLVLVVIPGFFDSSTSESPVPSEVADQLTSSAITIGAIVATSWIFKEVRQLIEAFNKDID